MTEAQQAHYKESQMSFTEFVESMNYEGLTPAQRQFGEEGLDYVYGRRQAPTPRDAEYYDTHERSKGLRLLASFNPENSDWYPEITDPVEQTTIAQYSAGAAVIDLASRRAA